MMAKLLLVKPLALALTSLFAAHAYGAKVGYYEMCTALGQPWHVPPITMAGHTPVQLNDLTTANLTNVDVIFVTNCNNMGYGPLFLAHLPDIHSAVYDGKVLVIHDRHVDTAETILPNSAGFDIRRDFSDEKDRDTEVIDDTTLVTHGPGGPVDNTLLDRGSSSHHGYTVASSTGLTDKRILSRKNPNEVVTFSYRYGKGQVIYSTIPLDYYLQGFRPDLPGFDKVYAPNVVAYAASLVNVRPVANAGADRSVAEGSLVQLDGSGNDPQGEAIQFAWQQVPGTPQVTLSNLADPKPTFTAPWVDSNTTLTFQLTVTDASGNTSDAAFVNIRVQQNNSRPIADAGDDTSIKEGARKQLDGSRSYDPDVGDSKLSYIWAQQGGSPVTLENATSATPSFIAPVGKAGEILTFMLTVSDGKEQSAPSTVKVAIVNNSAPIANAGDPVTVSENQSASLNGGLSIDPDSDKLIYSWSQIKNGSPTVTLSDPTSVTPSFTAPWVSAGGAKLLFRLTVSDGDPVNPKSSSADVTINVLNTNDPPNCTLARPSLPTLWPPDHTLVPVSIVGITDDSNGFGIKITGVSQDEPVNGLGADDTSPDAVIVTRPDTPVDNLALRAERAENGDGRVYRVKFTASDQEGKCNGQVNVAVPHDRKGIAIDNEGYFDSTKP